MNFLTQLIPMISSFFRGNQDSGKQLADLLENNQGEVMSAAQQFLQQAGSRGLQSGGNDALTASLLTKSMEKNDQINDEIRRKFLDSSTVGKTSVVDAKTVRDEAERRSNELEKRIAESELSLKEELKRYFDEQLKDKK